MSLRLYGRRAHLSRQSTRTPVESKVCDACHKQLHSTAHVLTIKIAGAGSPDVPVRGSEQMIAIHNVADDLDRLRQPDEAKAIVLAHARPLSPESVPLAEASWRVLADEVIATEDHPPFPAATMDGYAVVAADSSPWREVVGVQTAGSMIETEVTDGYAVRITTGAPFPRGADAVLKVENTQVAEDHVIVHQESVARGENIRPIGSDVRRGDPLLPAGARIGPAEIGLLAGLGLTPVSVRRRPRVSVVSTGDELVDPDQPLR